MQQHRLVILDRHIRLPVTLLHRDPHEEPTYERAADVLVVFFILKGHADELDLGALHDGAELLTNVVSGLEGTEGEKVLVAPFLGVSLRVGGFEGMVDIEHGQVITVRVGEELFHFVSALPGGGGTDENLGDGEEGRDGEDFVGAVEFWG